MEQVQPTCMEYCEHEEKEVEFSLLKETDYLSLYVIEETDHLESEDVEYVLTNVLF